MGSVKPPLVGQPQFPPLFTAVGSVLQIVAANFQALHAVESPALNGYTPPFSVGAVLS